MKKWLIRILVVLGLLILAMFITGTSLPEQHTATTTQAFTASREEVWKVITDFGDWPTWRTDLKEIRAGNNTFTEVSTNGDVIEYRIEDFKPPERLVTRIVTEGLPYGGSWTYEITPAETGCSLTITENGEVYNPMFRFLSVYMMGHTATMEQYLSDLKKKIP